MVRSRRPQRISRAQPHGAIVRLGFAAGVDAAERRTPLHSGAETEQPIETDAVVDVVLRPGPPAAESAGVVQAIDLHTLGMTVVALGGGRTRPQDNIDHSVGFDRLLGLGAEVERGMPLGRIHARSEAEADNGAMRLRTAYALGPSAPDHPLIVARQSGENR